MKLDSQTMLIDDLPADCIAQMQQLMRAHYDGVSESQFLADLLAKRWVILLYDHDNLCGFSTQVIFDHEHDGRRVKILYSGDTIIDKSHWGSLALPVAWGRLMLSLRTANPTSELYWLLTTKGYKTYRFLPVFFYEFHPSCTAEAPAFEKALLTSVASHRFGKRFNKATGILRAEQGAQRLREGIAAIDDKRLHDPHVAFFQKMNPGHTNGDELVCLTRFHPDNLKPYIRRQL